MKKYEFFEHTADAKFKAYGKTLEEAFANAAEAMYDIILDQEQLEEMEARNIELKGHDEKALLYNFLEELIFLLDAEFFALKATKSMRITKEGEGFSLTATLWGQKLNSGIQTEKHVKAVTYNDMEINHDKKSGHYEVQVVLDL